MELLRRGASIEDIHEKTGIDLFFLTCFELMIGKKRKFHLHHLKMYQKINFKLGRKKDLVTRFIASEWEIDEAEIRQ